MITIAFNGLNATVRQEQVYDYAVSQEPQFVDMLTIQKGNGQTFSAPLAEVVPLFDALRGLWEARRKP